MTHPNQVQPKRRDISRQRRPRPPRMQRGRPGFAVTRWRTGDGPHFPPDESRLPEHWHPAALDRPSRAPRGTRMGAEDRILGYLRAGRLAGSAVKASLTGSQRRRVAHKAHMTPAERATLAGLGRWGRPDDRRPARPARTRSSTRAGPAANLPRKSCRLRPRPDRRARQGHPRGLGQVDRGLPHRRQVLVQADPRHRPRRDGGEPRSGVKQ